MNLILFEENELNRPLRPEDPRHRHLREVLRRRVGEGFDCGIVDGPRGRAVIEADDPAGLRLSFTWNEAPPAPLDPVWLMIGLPRPQTARKILVEASAIGVSGLVFFAADRGEPSYADSRLWTSGEVRRHLVAGAEQAFATRLPVTALVRDLAAALERTPNEAARVALDNYEATAGLASWSPAAATATSAVLAIGPERGWSAGERNFLREHGFALAHLGSRVLRAETAAVAGLTLLKARLGLLG